MYGLSDKIELRANKIINGADQISMKYYCTFWWDDFLNNLLKLVSRFLFFYVFLPETRKKAFYWNSHELNFGQSLQLGITFTSIVDNCSSCLWWWHILLSVDIIKAKKGILILLCATCWLSVSTNTYYYKLQNNWKSWTSLWLWLWSEFCFRSYVQTVLPNICLHTVSMINKRLK